jgi:hypothetical protein
MDNNFLNKCVTFNIENLRGKCVKFAPVGVVPYKDEPTEFVVLALSSDLQGKYLRIPFKACGNSLSSKCICGVATNFNAIYTLKIVDDKVFFLRDATVNSKDYFIDSYDKTIDTFKAHHIK